ncbi:MAG: TadE/TadG family type IV pilus assembly protein [Trebonia sp.]
MRRRDAARRRPSRGAAAWRAARALARSDRGSSAVELAFLAPAFLGVIMLIIQFGLWFNAREVALASAQSGARVAREEAGDQTQLRWQGDATGTAESYYRGLNTHLLGSLSATAVNSTAGGAPAVGVTVSGPLGYSVFSWFGATWTVTATVTGPVECFHLAAVNETCGVNG